ncbi:MAG TPA: universal stress protein [Thermoleophilaceae bacterium]|nr:universal stress protein [Thermoleophilaceae bacterium]
MSATRPILFATDGSPASAEAQGEAIELARLLGAPLVVVSVLHASLPAVGYSGYGYSSLLAELTQAEQKRVEKLLASVAETAEAHGVACSTAAADGIVVDEICRTASDHDAQLIVVGSHGWGAAKRIFSGSVSTGLVHSAPCPVLVVRRAQHAQEHAAAA